MTNNLMKRKGFQTLAALSLSLSLAAFGCSTNRTPGNGEPASPVRAMPSSTPGSSSGTDGTHPMMSSSIERDTAPAAPVSRADDAAATLAFINGHRGRDLGPA
ncbi:MAG TPA: hypothetical protein VJ276_15075, partial [Thermoanaerobaculia bacterium]|nr:hypothetical protein [Thermoanaerobaculia bacterium]